MKKQTTFTLSPEVRALIRALATADGISMAAVIEMAVRFFAKSKRQPIEHVAQEPQL